jgi:hypothetical protein
MQNVPPMLRRLGFLIMKSCIYTYKIKSNKKYTLKKKKNIIFIENVIFKQNMSKISKLFLEPLNNYGCSRVWLLSQGLERTSQDGKLTYQTF